MVMEHLRQYSKKQLESKSTSELEWHYMDAYKIAHSSGMIENDSRLKMITGILFGRNELREKLIIKCQIKQRLEEAVRREGYEEAATFRDMLKHYEQHIMG
ncbi:UvrB/UvrC motif-containing protein [Candidatus Pacearchaeota archaeon]|nr:UvrB/UvrC motif-containing protein [Candidatus Pacearchaeota archaeon]